jgi:hypothetical protein
MRWAALLLGQSFLVLSRILVDKKIAAHLSTRRVSTIKYAFTAISMALMPLAEPYREARRCSNGFGAGRMPIIIVAVPAQAIVETTASS